MEQKAIRYNFKFKSWTVKELTVDKNISADEIFYNIKQEWVFKDELKGAIADIVIAAVTDRENPEVTAVASLRLSCDLDITGFTSEVPKEVFGQIGFILLNTARGVFLQAGAGTILARYPLPMISVEQLAGM